MVLKENTEGKENIESPIEQAGFIVGVLSLCDNKELAKYILENDTDNYQLILKEKINEYVNKNSENKDLGNGLMNKAFLEKEKSIIDGLEKLKNELIRHIQNYEFDSFGTEIQIKSALSSAKISNNISFKIIKKFADKN